MISIIIFVLQWDDPNRNCPKNSTEVPTRPATAFRKVFNPRTFNEELVETTEAELYIEGDIQAQIESTEQVRPKKKVVINKRDEAMQKALDAERANKAHTETAPREVIAIDEGALIQNYEVDFGPEEELVMAGGIRGIRALRV